MSRTQRSSSMWVLLVIGLAVVVPQMSSAQGDPRHEERILQNIQTQRDWRTRINQVDHLVKLGSLGRATTMLEQMEKTGAPRELTLMVWVRLAVAREEYDKVVTLCEEGLETRPHSLRLLRPYAHALIMTDRLVQGREAIELLVGSAQNKITVLAQTVSMWRELGYPEEGLSLCDSLRIARDDARLLRRPRALCLLDLDRIDDGMTEFIDELEGNPLNIALVRDEILIHLNDDKARRRAIKALSRDVSDDARVPVVLLCSDLLLRIGDVDKAIDAVMPLLETEAGLTALLRMATAVLRETPIISDPVYAAGNYRWLLTVLEGAAVARLDHRRTGSLRIHELLADATIGALEGGFLDVDHERAVQRVEQVLNLLRREAPGSTRLYSAQVLLARHTREVLHQPRAAAERLELLLTDMDFPLQGLALCRLELGLCYFAEADTVRARRVLTRLGRDGQYPEAAGSAHYLLAQLDLAQGNWESSRDRLAAVALDNPRADHANDALNLALLLANELERLDSAPDLFDAFAESMLWRLLHRPVLRQAALEHMLEVASATPALSRESDLVSRGRLDLAQMLADQGEFLAAAVLCRAVVSDRPDGPFAPQALEHQGAWYFAAGDGATARRSWERLLAQYPDAIYAEDARLRLRELP